MKEVMFNLNWYMEVTLNKKGAELWNANIEGTIHGKRKAGDKVKEQAWRLIYLFGPKFFMWETPIQPQVKLFIERGE